VFNGVTIQFIRSLTVEEDCPISDLTIFQIATE